MRIIRKSCRALLAFPIAAALFAACSPQQTTPTRHVNIYTARHYDSDQILYDAFEEKTGIKVRVLPAAGDQLLERLRIEGDATEADVVITADAGNLYRLQEAGLLAPVVTETLSAAVPARLHEPQGYWWGFSKRARVIVYNKSAIDPATIASMDDLAGPALRGKVCARSSSNVYNLSMLAARIARTGPEAAEAWARGVRGNFARDPQGGDIDQIRAVAAGECQVAISNHYYYLRLVTSPDPADKAVADAVGLLFPDQAGAGTHVNISGAGISAYAKRRDEAVMLLEFLVSDEAQRLLAPLNEEYPIRPGIPPTEALAALGTFKEEVAPLDALGRHQAEAARIFEAVGWR